MENIKRVLEIHKGQMDMINESLSQAAEQKEEVKSINCFRCDSPEIVCLDDNKNWHCSDCHSKLMED